MQESAATAEKEIPAFAGMTVFRTAYKSTPKSKNSIPKNNFGKSKSLNYLITKFRFCNVFSPKILFGVDSYY
jgi:hypothetical protein